MCLPSLLPSRAVANLTCSCFGMPTVLVPNPRNGWSVVSAPSRGRFRSNQSRESVDQQLSFFCAPWARVSTHMAGLLLEHACLSCDDSVRHPLSEDIPLGENGCMGGHEDEDKERVSLWGL